MKKLISILTLIICIFCFPACKQGGENLSVYAPDGAPALALSYAMETIDGVDFNVVGAEVIKAKVTGESPVADVAIVPINVASLYLGSGDVYQALGVVTHGNFYFLSEGEETLTRENLSGAIGKTIGVVQLPNIPGLALKVALSELGISYKELINGETADSDKVNLLAIKPTEIGQLSCEYYLAPSPVADGKARDLGLNFSGSLHSLYEGNSFPQAMLVAKKSVISDNFGKVKSIVNALSYSGEFLKIENKTKILSLINGNLENGLTPTYNQNNFTEKAIERANINFVSSPNCKSKVIEFLQRVKTVNFSAVNVFEEKFFYTGAF